MIKKLSLKGFKTHKDTELEFSSGVNVITGDSGHGKTNILLALSWVADNRPLGTSCIKRGQDICTVVEEIVENHEVCSIVRRRSKTENTYSIGKDGKEIASFKSFGNAPPEEVSGILNLSDINMQKQRDQHFLVYSPPGQVATYIRSITKLDEIDQTSKLLSSKIRSVRDKLSHYQEDLGTTHKTLDVLNKINLELFESKIVEARSRFLRIGQLREEIEGIKSIIKELKILEKHRVVLPDNIDGVLGDIEKHSRSFVKTSQYVTELGSLLSRIKDNEAHRVVLPDNIDEILCDIEKYSGSFVKTLECVTVLESLLGEVKDNEAHMVVLPRNLEVLFIVEQTLEGYGDTHKKVKTTLELLEDIYDVELEVNNIDEQLKQLEYEEKQLKEKLSVCPLCGTELTEESKKVLLRG